MQEKVALDVKDDGTVFEKSSVMCVDNNFDVGIVRISLEHQATMTTTYWFPCAVFGSGPGYPWHQSRSVLRRERVQDVVCF